MINKSDQERVLQGPEPVETNNLMCVVLRVDGRIDRKPNGKIEQGDSLPQQGDVYFLFDMECQVIGHAYTPMLPDTWHLFLLEIGG